MKDQAFALRERVEAALPEASARANSSLPMVVVAGGRAGVGATTVAVNLAAVLADRGERVVLIDAARQAPIADQIAGAVGAVEHTLDDVLAGECGAADALVPGPCGALLLAGRRGATSRHSSELRNESRRALAASPAVDSSRQQQQRLLRELQSLEKVASVLVVDAGSGLTPWTRRFWLRGTLVLLVITTEDAVLLDAYAMVKRSTADGIKAKIGLLANQCDSDARARAVCGRFSSACRRFLALSVPPLPSLPRHVAEKHGRQTYPRIWESPNSPFGHGALWLGRAVSDVLALDEVANQSGPGGTHSVVRR